MSDSYSSDSSNSSESSNSSNSENSSHVLSVSSHASNPSNPSNPISAKSATLTDKIKIAIANENAALLAEYIQICDTLHKGLPCDPYTPKDLPTDALYEQMKKKYQTILSSLSAKIINAKKLPVKTKHELSDLHMAQDAIIKSPEVQLADTEVICLPKYDGVSCAIRFKLDTSTERFYVDEAVTRGTDIGYTHKNTDVKDRMIQLLSSPTCPWFAKRFHALRQKYTSITVRGEIVLIDKSIQPAAPYVAGKINSKSSILDPDGVIGFKMFEITRLVDLNGNSSIPSQKKACTLITQIDKSIPVVIKHLIDTDSNTKDMISLYHTWQESLDAPIDGIVYCSPTWSYPLYKEDAAGVGYGKYALKPNISAQSLFERVEYTMAKDGKLSPILYYKQIEINSKKYSKSKGSITALNSFIKFKNLHKGSTVEVTLQGSIIPQVTDVVYEECDDKSGKSRITLPKKCPFCKGELILKDEKSGKLVTLKCSNLTCPGIVVKQIVNMLKNLKIEGYAEKSVMKLLNENDNDYMKLFSAIDEKKGKNYVHNKIYNCTVGDLIYALNIATRTTMSKYPRVWSIRMNRVSEEILAVKEELKNKEGALVEMVSAYL